MGYVTREMIDRAKKMDLLTYLQTYEPQELVHFGGNTYCTREHDSLKISNGKWCWFSRGIGGKTALDYLIKVKELPFTEAVERIVGRAAERPSVFHARAQPEKPKTLLLPPKSNSNTRVIAYLKSRGIDGGLIEQCIRSGQLYESLPYHNAVFVGMDMVEGYGDGGNPVVDKSEFILSLFEQLDRGGIGPLQKSIIDRCVDAVYAAYKRGGPVPTLRVLREKLLAQPEEEARDLALALELFTTGSLDAFAHETNVDTQNRIVIYDIMDLGRQLKTMGLLIITDAMLNRVTENWRKGKRTHLFIDEFHVVFQNPYSADFFDSAWRRFRKRGAYPTAITQNVEYLLDSVQASTMLSNSEMLILLNQAPSDREKLAALLNISPEQTGYITNAPAGCGLLRYGGALVPFKNQFPKDTELYRLMTTKPDESIIVGGNTK